MATRKQLAAITPVPEGLDDTTRLETLWTQVYHLFDLVVNGVSNYDLEVARGNVEGVSRVNKFGTNPAIATADDPEDVWSTGGDIPYLAAAGSFEVFCGTAADDTGGTGMQSVTVEGLDANWDAKTQTVATAGAGTGITALTGTWMRIFRMYGATWGSGGANAGVIICRVASAGATHATIPLINGEGQNQSLMCSYTVPADKTAFIEAFHVGVGRLTSAGWAQAALQIRLEGGEFRTKHTTIASSNGSGHIMHNFNMPLTAPEKSDIKLRVLEVSATVQVDGGFDLYIVNDGAP